MKGNFKEYEQLAVELINNHAGFLPGQERERILHAQFELAKVITKVQQIEEKINE